MAPRAFDILRFLVENAGRLISHDVLLDTIWPDTFVNPEIVRKYILEIRKTLGDSFRQPVFIETHAKRGYRFIAPVEDLAANAVRIEPACYRSASNPRIETLIGALCEALNGVNDLQNVILVVGCIENGS